MKKGIGKTISIIAILTMTFQLGMPIIPGVQSETFATNITNSESSENIDTTETEEISRNYEIKKEEIWDISANGDGSVIAKWTFENRTLTISGTGEMAYMGGEEKKFWHKNGYTHFIENAVIGNGITNISGMAFDGCVNLKNITLPNSITEIEWYAFSQCESLQSIQISEGVTSIEQSAFSGCSSLTNITIPEGVTSIGSYAFSGCSSLTNITIPDEVTSIGDFAFYECSSLTEITIPEEVTRIEMSAFSGCSSLENINVDKNNLNYFSENGILYNKEKTKIIKYPEGKKDLKYTIPSSVSTIGIGSFEGCNYLKNIEISSNVTDIEVNAFKNCKVLENIEIPNSLTEMKAGLFEGCSSLKSIEIPSSITYIGNSVFSGCTSLTNIILPSSLVSLGNSTFRECVNLVDINLPDNLTSMGESVFNGCSSLSSINIPKAMTTIKSWAFYGCTNLTTVNIAEGVVSIGYLAFSGTNLDTINIPESVIEIDASAIPSGTIMYVKADSEAHKFAEEDKSGYILEGVANKISTDYELKSEEEWDISENEDNSVIARWTLENRTLTVTGTGKMKDWQLGENITDKNKKYTPFIEKAIINEGITNIGNGIFSRCIALKDVEIFANIITINWSAFSDCASLTNINIPNGVTQIENYAFSGCSKLRNIEIPQSVTNIEDDVFDDCKSLEKITVNEDNKNYTSDVGILFNKDKTILIKYPEGKQDIKEYEMPSSVIEIQEKAFEDCIHLESISMSNNIKSIGSHVFSGCENLKNIRMSNKLTTIEEYAFSGCSNLKNISLPKALIEIKEGAFYNCDSLESICISKNLSNIEDGAIPDETIIYAKLNTEAHRYAEKSEQGYILDDIAPTVKFTSNTIENVQKEYSVKIEVEDNLKEVGVDDSSLKYQWTPSEESPTKESFTESFENGQTITKNTGDGKWYLWVYAEDNVGNETITRSEAFNFDNTAPNGSIEYSTKNPTKENVIVTITSNEEIQEVEGWTLSSDKKVLIKEYSANTKETITIKDLAGNEAQANIEISNIDKIAPNMNVEYSTKNPTNKNVTVTITSNEEIQEVEGWTLSSDKRVLTKEYDENTKETITIKDLAGNEAQANIEITNIDNTLPEITIGDINQDEKIDVTDLLMLKRHLVAGSRESWKLAGDRLLASDMNEDGNVDITDMLMLKRIIVEDM